MNLPTAPQSLRGMEHCGPQKGTRVTEIKTQVSSTLPVGKNTDKRKERCQKQQTNKMER